MLGFDMFITLWKTMSTERTEAIKVWTMPNQKKGIDAQ